MVWQSASFGVGVEVIRVFQGALLMDWIILWQSAQLYSGVRCSQSCMRARRSSRRAWLRGSGNECFDQQWMQRRSRYDSRSYSGSRGSWVVAIFASWPAKFSTPCTLWILVEPRRKAGPRSRSPMHYSILNDLAICRRKWARIGQRYIPCFRTTGFVFFSPILPEWSCSKNSVPFASALLVYHTFPLHLAWPLGPAGWLMWIIWQISEALTFAKRPEPERIGLRCTPLDDFAKPYSGDASRKRSGWEHWALVSCYRRLVFRHVDLAVR